MAFSSNLNPYAPLYYPSSVQSYDHGVPFPPPPPSFRSLHNVYSYKINCNPNFTPSPLFCPSFPFYPVVILTPRVITNHVYLNPKYLPPQTSSKEEIELGHSTTVLGIQRRLTSAAPVSEGSKEESLVKYKVEGICGESAAATRRSSSFKRAKKIKGRSRTDKMERFKFQEAKASLNQGSRTTLMIKNIPCCLDKKKLLHLLDEHCRKVNEQLQVDGGGDSTSSEFDFMYLPMDFSTGCNLGYAFVNFTSPLAAYRLYRELQGKSWADLGSPKVCEVTYARLQGIRALLGHFKNSVFTCENGEFRPIHFAPSRNGLRSTKQQFIGWHVPQPGKEEEPDHFLN